MILTSVFSTIYLRYINIPDYALGAKGIRLALVVRGLSGTLGVYGLYCMPLSQSSHRPNQVVYPVLTVEYQ